MHSRESGVSPGVYRVHKPVGETSFSLVKRFLDERDRAGPGRRLPLCHGGTLDPFAEGLLLILVGESTHLFERLHALPKTYRARVAWGLEMDNGEHTGREVARGDAMTLTPDSLEGALAPFLGWQEQVPPATSAKKLSGEPAYRKAHRGEVFTLPPSRVYLHSARWTGHALPAWSELELICRGGFYVRSLVTELGRALGCRAHLVALKRTSIGPWEDPGPETRIHHRGPDAVPWLPLRAVTDTERGALRRNEAIPRAGGTRGAELLPPAWPFPAGFPLPEPTVAALHQRRVVALLVPGPGGILVPQKDLRRGF